MNRTSLNCSECETEIIDTAKLKFGVFKLQCEQCLTSITVKKSMYGVEVVNQLDRKLIETSLHRPTIVDTIPGPRPMTVCINPSCSTGLVPEQAYYGQWLMGFVYADLGYGRMAYYPNKKSGYICNDCAGNYHTLTDKHGNKHQVCVTEIKPEIKWEVGRFK